jgi:tRNA-2-methylthio-N6-dimethylallyladenosine synthase
MIGVGGCVASQEGAAIVKRAPYVDLVFGPQTLHRLPELIRARARPASRRSTSAFPEIEKFDRLPEPRAEGPSAFVSIMEAARSTARSAWFPYTRGEEVSRPFEDVLVEVAQLAAQGVREVNLLGTESQRLSRPLWRGEICRPRPADPHHRRDRGIGRIRFTTRIRWNSATR